MESIRGFLSVRDLLLVVDNHLFRFDWCGSFSFFDDDDNVLFSKTLRNNFLLFSSQNNLILSEGFAGVGSLSLSSSHGLFETKKNKKIKNK